MHAFHRAFLTASAVLALAFTQVSFANVFTPTGGLSTGRYGAFAARLPDGKVLIAGGYNGSSLDSAEIYDPGTGTFSHASNTLSAARGFGTTTVLQDGRVLLAGGGAYDDTTNLTTADIYNPSTGMFTPTGSMHVQRASMTATLLANGKVLIAGGMASDGVTRLASAELYDPVTGTFTQTGNMNYATDDGVAVRLPNGKVLMAGGGNGGATSLATAELYDPATGTFMPTGSMTVGRDDAVAVLLNNGKVLVASGGNMDQSVGTADLYDPATGTFTASHSTFPPRDFASVVTLSDGKVLLIGGRIDSTNANTGSLNTAVLYDPDSDTFTTTASMTTARFYFPAIVLQNGNVLVAGGYNNDGVVGSAEIFSSNDTIFANGFEGP